MAVMTLEEYKKKKKEAEMEQPKSSVMTLDEYRKTSEYEPKKYPKKTISKTNTDSLSTTSIKETSNNKIEPKTNFKSDKYNKLTENNTGKFNTISKNNTGKYSTLEQTKLPSKNNFQSQFNIQKNNILPKKGFQNQIQAQNFMANNVWYQKQQELKAKKEARIKELEEQLPILQNELNKLYSKPKNGSIYYNTLNDDERVGKLIEYNKLQKEYDKLKNGNNIKIDLFSTGAFKDGYDFGDVTRSIIGTGGNIISAVGQAPWEIGHGIGKLIVGANAQVLDWMGKDEYAQKLRDRISGKDPSANEKIDNWNVFKKIDKATKDDSLLGDTSDELIKGLSKMYAYSVAPESAMFADAAGESLSDSYAKGANNKQAWIRAVGSGALAYESEKVGGHFGKTGLDDAVANKLSSKVTSNGSKYFIRQAVPAVSEAGEELLEYSGNQLLDRVMDATSKDTDAKFHEKWDWNAVGKDMTMAFITSGLASSGKTISDVHQIKNNTGLNTKQAFNEYVNQMEANSELPVLKTKKQNQKSQELKNNVRFYEKNTQINENKSDIQKLPTNTTNNTNLQEINQNNVQNKQIVPVKTVETNNEIENNIQNTNDNVEEQITKTQNAIENLKNMRETAKTKAEQIKIDSHIQQLENEVQELQNNSTTFAKDNKIMSDIQQRTESLKSELNLPKATTEGMTLQESAARYNIAPDSETITSLQEMYDKRGIDSRFDASKFNDNSVNAIWYKDADGNRSVILNPNATTNDIIENLAIHELTHDIMSSENSAKVLKAQEIIDYVKTIEGYDQARKSLEQTYSTMYDPNSENFQSLIDEEVVADVLGKKLGNQEFINRLVYEKPSVARRIYDWVKNKIVNRGGKVRNTDVFWKNVANRFEKAYNKEYNNSNEADTRFATVKNNPYGHVKDFVKLKQNIQSDAHNAISPVAAELSAKGKLYGSATDINGITYDFEIFDDTTYRVTEVDFNNNVNVKEVVDEKYSKTNSRYSLRSTVNEQSNNDINNESNTNRRTSNEDVEISTKEQEQQRSDGYRLSDTEQKENNRELKSSFSDEKRYSKESTKWNDFLDKNLNKNNDLRDRAKEELGTTTNLNEAGYLTNDGEYLDFSGKKQGARGGQRQMDHREIADVYSDSEYDNAESKYPNMGSNTAVLQDFLDRGNIRLNGTGVEIATAPTKEQYSKLYDYLEHVQQDNGEVFVDLDTETNNRENLEYSDKTSIRKIINDIKQHYDNSNNVETAVTDNQGRKLSKQQQEYFKDSKVRDENGQLITVYHGTTEEINIFDKNRLGKNTGAASAGEGFFFTDNKKIAEDYSKYARPQYIKDLENEYKRLEKIAQKTGNWDDYYRAYEKYEDAELTYAYNEDNQRTNAENQKEVYLNLTNPLIHDFKGMEYRDESYYDLLKQAKENGNDGAIFKNTYDGYGEKGSWDNPMTNIYVAFESNQIKNVDNTNPTSNEDIRYSKENDKWNEWKNKYFETEGTTHTLSDLKLPTKEKTKLPVKEVTKKETKQIAPVKEKKEVKLPVKEIPKNPTKESTYDEKAYDRKKQHEKLIKQEVKAKVKNESQKAINIATKVGQKYLELDRTQKAELREQLSKYTGKTRKQLTNSKTWNEIKDIVNNYAEKQITYIDEEVKDIKNEIRNTKIKIDDNIKSQITDYNDFKKENFGKLKLSNSGVSLDSMYQELSEQYPYYFSESTSEADMLYELSEFMDKDTNMYEKIKLSDSTLDKATTKIYNSLLQNTMNVDAINELKEEIQKKYNKRTRKIVQKELQDIMGITEEDLQIGKDISSLEYQRTDPIRLNEKVFGYDTGKKINDATINFTKHQEAERTRFLNKERNEIKELGIKPRTKESAAVQKYGEKQYVNQYGEVLKYGDKELQAEFPSSKDQAKIKKAAEVIRNKYDNYIDNINEVITEMGYDPIPKRKDYMRHFMELNDKLSQWGIPLNRESLSKDSLPTDINGITDQFKPGKNWFASAMQRKGFKTTYDAITGIDGYLESASNLMYHTESIQRYRTLSKLIRETYGQQHGLDNIDVSTETGQKRLNDIMDNKLSKYAAWLDEQANALAGKKGGIDRAAERLLGRKVYSVLDTAKKQVGSNMTGFNVRSALTNFASAVQGASKTNKIAWTKGTLSTVKNIIHNDGLINKSDFLTSRFGSDQLSKKLWQKASNAGQIFMTGTDYFTANQIWRSKYYENLSKGMTEQQAIKNADDFSARIMGDRSKGSTAEIFNSKTLGLLTQFQLEVNNQWSSIIHDNKMDVQRGNKSGATVLFQLGQLSAMSYLFNNFMKSLTGSDVMIDPIDILKQIFGGDDDDDIEERAEKVLGDLVNDLPFVSFLTGGRIPISEAFTGANTFTKKITGQKDKWGNPIKWEDVKNDTISSGFYWLLPTGYGQAKKTTKGVSMYDSKLPVAGSYTKSGNLRFTADESTGGKIKAALFGQYTNDEARKYIESGYKTIYKTKIDEMKDLGMKSSEYREYRSGLSQAGTTNESKINYIVNLDNVSNKQKNIMASNLLSRDFNVNEYKKYGSYDEYNYAYHYPEKYSLITQITSYNKYQKYNDELKDIRDNTTNDKEETIKYINSLNLSIPQKAMYIKSYYKSFDQYDLQIINYINDQKLTIKEKTKILEQLGFTIKDGRVY